MVSRKFPISASQTNIAIIVVKQNYTDLTELQKQELDRRIADSEVNPDNLLTWEEVQASITAPR
jgi:putative addiction module component (TIGR02574 family)